MTTKQRYWNRILDCGHSRLTNLPFISGNYDKPKIDDSCYCRQCMNESKIINVEEANNEEYRNIRNWDKMFDKIRKQNKG